MRILDRYAIGEIVVPFAIGFFVILVLLIGNVLFINIDLIVSRLHEWPEILRLIALKTPYFMVLALPSGALFGCALAVSRLSRDSEFTMMRMAGASMKRIFLPFILVGALVSAAAFYVQEKVTPWAESQSYKTLLRLWSSQGPPPIQANVFFQSENYYFYVQQIDRRSGEMVLRNIMVYELPTGEGYPMLTTARTARQEGNVWILEDGVVRKIGKDGFTEQEGPFKRAKLDLRRPMTTFEDTAKNPDQMTISELREKIDVFSASGMEASRMKMSYHFKLALPLSSLILMLCVAPLSLRFGRSGSFTGVLLGIVVLFLYWNVILFAKALGGAGMLPPILAGWSEVIIFGIIGAYLMWRAG